MNNLDKTVEMFLASSIVEFKDERSDLMNTLRLLNNITVRNGLFFRLDYCSNYDNHIQKDGMQNKYNRIIRNSEFVLFLIGKSVGMYTLEEFEIASNGFKENSYPHITVNIKEMDEDSRNDSFKEFSDKIKGIDEIKKVIYSDLRDVKIEMIKTLEQRLKSSGILVRFDNKKCYLNGIKLF